MVKPLLRPSLLTAVFAACLFFAVLGAKWATFDRYGSAMPDWDQWDAEALELLVPWYEHDHFVTHLFNAHNEHRVVLTKLQNLSLTLLNGQWDARLEAVTNALVHSALATALWLLAARRLRLNPESVAPPVSPDSVSNGSTLPPPHFSLAALWLLAFALFGLPLAWQNILGGFHSQQYWLLVTSFTAIVVLPFARLWSPAWWAAASAAVLALFTMGSGLLAGAVILVVLGFRLLRRETTLRAVWPALALCCALVVIGLLTRVEVDYHAHMKAKTLHDFFFSLVHSLQWPVPSGYDWLAAVLWLPWLLAAVRMWFVREPGSARTGQTFVALGGWVIVQLLATAYARGANADFPASRYMDTLTFGTMVNGLSLAWLLGSFHPSWPRTALRLLTVAWTLTFLFGLQDLVRRNVEHELPDARKYYDKAEANLRAFLATNDPAQLGFRDIPYPSAEGLIDRLSHPSLRALMPVVVRAPLPLTPATPSSVFSLNQASQLNLPAAPRHGLSPTTGALASLPSWGSFDRTAGPAATGEWRSAPLTSPLGAYLKFETAGHLGTTPTITLELHDAQTDALLATIVPSKVPGDAWRSAYVRAPRQPFVVVARDQDSARWLAFSAPVEMGTLSYLAFQAAKHGLLLAQIAFVIAAALAGLVWFTRPRSPRPKAKPAPVPSVASSAPASASHTSSVSPALRFALALALFLAIWGTKLVTLDRYGSDLPYWDQWAKEGDYLLTPWFERHELWNNLFLPHNEHRIAPTLALNLALVTGGGQWDARVQCAASAALHAALAAGLFLWASRRFSRAWSLAVGLVLLLAVAPPIAWENVLGGFQSQFYFLAGFTLLSLGLLLTSPALSRRWWCGVAAGLLALVSMGSGLLLAAPLLASATLRLITSKSDRRDTLLTLAAALALGGIGAALRTPAQWHDTLHAKTVAEFLLYAARCLSWPLPQYPWLAPLLWLPWLALLTQRLTSFKAQSSKLEVQNSSTDFLLAAGLWVLLQVAAVTYSRAGGGGYPASRYGDIAALGLIVSFFALAQLASTRPSVRPTARFAFPLLAALHVALVAAIVVLATRAVLAGPLPDKRKESAASERSVQAFVLTDDYATFAKSPLPFPLPDWLARILRRPDIRAVLPTSVRAPLPIADFSVTPLPPAPPFWERRTHSVHTAGEWRSAPLPPATMGYWKFEVTGPAFTSPALFLSAASSPLLPIAPSRAPRPEEWRAAFIPAPTAPATLVARAPSSDRWLALTEPVEMSALSYRTWQLSKHASWLCAAGLLGFVLLALLTLLPTRRAASARS